MCTVLYKINAKLFSDMRNGLPHNFLTINITFGIPHNLMSITYEILLMMNSFRAIADDEQSYI